MAPIAQLAVDRPSALRRFVEFLVVSRGFTMSQLKRAALVRRSLDSRFGQLALVRGELTSRDLLRVLATQAERDDRFGDLCVSMGFLTSESRDGILLAQEDEVRLLGECLVLTGAVPTEQLPGLLERFRNSNESPISADSSSPRRAREVRQVLRRIGNLATLPEVVQNALTMLEDPDCRLESVAQLLESDPVMSAQLLRLVNSPFFGIRNKVSSLSKALVLLGVRSLRQVILTSVVTSRFETLGRERAQALWMHSIKTACWARCLASRGGGRDAQEYATAGIVHELGVPVLHQHFPGEMSSVMRLCAGGEEELPAEKRVLGITHCEVGAFLGQAWKFSSALCEGMQLHHESVAVLRSVRSLTEGAAIVHASCRLAEAAGDPAKRGWVDALDEDFLVFHRLTRGFLTESALRVWNEARELSERLF